MTTNTNTNAAANTAPASLAYRVELRASDNRTTRGSFARWGSPKRVWVRGYAPDGSRVFEQHLGFCDGRYTGPRSATGRLLASAEALAAALAAAA